MNNRIILVFALLLIFNAPLFSQEKKKPLKKEKSVILKDKKPLNNTESKKDIQNTSSQSLDIIVEELDQTPPSVVQVETAIPAFIGYTEKGPTQPTQVNTMEEYKALFGGPSSDEIGTFQIENDGTIISPAISLTPKYMMYYMLEMFFANGGGKCFIVSVGNYNTYQNSIVNEKMLSGLDLLNDQDLPTLILFPDATSSKNTANPSTLYQAALAQCAEKKDRFLICDVKEINDKRSNSVEEFRFSIGQNNLKYGAAYFPSLKTELKYTYAENKIKVKLNETGKVLALNNASKPEESLFHTENGKYRDAYNEIKNLIYAKNLILPPSAAVAGVYVKTDGTRGVWKAPANVSLNRVQAPTIEITNSDQENLNVHSSGKSINAIRSFEGKGVLIWGARTLDGNDNEWRYISTRRLFNMVEESVQKAIVKFGNEPNNQNTWVKVQAMTENYLNTLWRSGALAGAKPSQAFYVKIGLGETMTQQDVLNGKMILEIGLSVIRPAEFITLRLTQEMNK